MGSRYVVYNSDRKRYCCRFFVIFKGWPYTRFKFLAKRLGKFEAGMMVNGIAAFELEKCKAIKVGF